MEITAAIRPFFDLLARGRYAFELLLERRLWLFAVADLALVTRGLFAALLGSGRLDELYRSMAVEPTLILAVPVLAGVVALERRAGSLDLALAAPSTELYFLRRVVPVCGFFVVQAWLLTLAAYLTVLESRFPSYLLSTRGALVLPVLLHTLLVALLVAAVTLFWASRLATAGATMAASFATLFALSRWIFSSPVVGELGLPATWWLGVFPGALVALAWNLAVLALAAALFYLYARQRLRRPETVLA